MIYVDHEQLDAAVQNYGNRHEKLETILDTLESDLAPMVAGWEGNAQLLYVEKKAAWEKASRELADLLKTIKKLTADAHEGYTKTVAANVELWS